MPPAGRDNHTVASILTPHEHTRHMESLERGNITVSPHEGEGDDDGTHFFPDEGSLQGADSPPRPPRRLATTAAMDHSSSSSPGTFSKSYVAGLWIALGLAMLALVAVTAFQVYSGVEKNDEERHSIQAASGAVLDSNSAVALVTKQQERLNALNMSLAKFEAEQAELTTALQTQQTDFLTKLGEEQQARSISLCTQLLDTLQDTTIPPTAAAGQTHTEYVCQAQNGWQLTACPTTAVVVQALLGRFTSAADGPCTDRGNAAAWSLENCPNSVDVTTAVQQALAQAKGGPVLDTPMQLLQSGGLRADPCPRAYKQLQVVYNCPVAGGGGMMVKLDAAGRMAKCEEMLAKDGGRVAAAAAAPAAAAPQK